VTAPQPLEFVSEDEQGGDPIPVGITMKRSGSNEKVRQVFHARADVSFGALLDDLAVVDNSLPYRVMRRVLVTDNTEPTTKHRTEYDRFHAFVTDPDLYIDQKTLVAIVNQLTERYSDEEEFPTAPPAASRATRRAAPRGSAATRPRRG
jgi:hypothetical protein